MISVPKFVEIRDRSSIAAAGRSWGSNMIAGSKFSISFRSCAGDVGGDERCESMEMDEIDAIPEPEQYPPSSLSFGEIGCILCSQDETLSICMGNVTQQL